MEIGVAAVGAEETPAGEWSVTRLRTAAHGTVSSLGLSLGLGPRGGLGEKGDMVARQLVLTKSSLVERRPDNYEVPLVSPLCASCGLLQPCWICRETSVVLTFSKRT